jgi:hypothetical protein
MNELNPICDGEKFELLASTDRTSFVLRSKSDFYIAHLEGSEAAHFNDDFREIQQQFPALDSDQALTRLWDEHGYRWFAAQYAD